MLLSLSVLLVLPRHSHAATGEPAISAVLQYGPNLPPENWLPVKFQFDNPTDHAIGGAAAMLVKGKSASAEFRLPVEVPAHSRLITTGYAWFGPIPPIAKNPIHPVSVARWEDDQLREISRCDLLAQPLSDRGIEFPTGAPGAVLMVIGKMDSRPSSDSSQFRDLIAQVSGYPLAHTIVSPEDLPREFAAYEACKYLVWGEADPNELDPAQRHAILDFLNVGGALIVSSPPGSFDPSDSWMGSLLPVRIIGHRQCAQIDAPGQSPLLMREPVDMCEAIENDPGHDDRIVLRDADYVHAAIRPIGMGRVVFTSFPIFGLETHKEPRVADLWRRLLDPSSQRIGWQGTQLETKNQVLLESMLGQSTVRWSVAAGVAVGFVALVLLSQLFFTGFRRPSAFVATVGISVILTAALMAAGAMRRQDQQLRGARISLFDASPAGGGIRHEILAWLGQERDGFGIRGAEPNMSLRPIIDKPSDPPRVIVRPFAVSDAGAHALKVERVWQADGLGPSSLRVTARGQFGPNGLMIAVDNALGLPLREPLFLCDGNAFPLNDAPVGSSQLPPGRRNPHGVFVNASLSISQAQRLRGNLVAALSSVSDSSYLTRAYEPPPLIMGHCDDALLAPLVTPIDGSEPPLRIESLVRIPLRIDPSPVGSSIRIDGDLMRMESGLVRAIPYQAWSQQWIKSNLGTEMLITFVPPPEIGTLHTARATIRLDISAPSQTVTVQRGQRAGGVLRENAYGPVVAEWVHPLGLQQLSFDCTSDDQDEAGRVWLRISVSGATVGPGGVAPEWVINDLRFDYESQVVGPPREVMLGERAIERVRETPREPRIHH